MVDETRDRSRGRPHVGFICNADHDVFGDVADRLEREHITVRFFEPGAPIPDEDVEGLSLLLNKKVAPESFRALAVADRNGVPTWNGSGTVQLGIRLAGYRALAQVGCRVPETTFAPPDGDHVAKSFIDWYYEPDPVCNGEGDLYQPLLPTTAVDHKYYAVDTGDGIEVRVLQTTSKLDGEKAPLGVTDPEPALAERVRRLLRVTDSQALGVDVVETDEGFWAVDVNPAMSFRHAEMESHLAASVRARLAATRPEETVA
jgi:hypothetical protein